MEMTFGTRVLNGLLKTTVAFLVGTLLFVVVGLVLAAAGIA